MRSYPIVLVLLAGAACVLSSEITLAQTNGGVNRNAFSRGRSSFRHNTNYLRQSYSRPTVSPYLNLLREDGIGLPTYHTTVRPTLQQRSTNQQQAQAIRQVQNQFNSVIASQQSGRGQRTGIRATGHATQFMNFLHYYPAFNRR
jgi:hypothetical protein